MIAIRDITIPRQGRQIAQGQTVDIIASIVSTQLVASLYDPLYTPLITLYNPSGTALVTDADMTKLSTGLYLYRYQTGMASPLGIYTVSVKAIDTGQVAITEQRSVFKVVVATTLPTFTYFAIKDQDAAVWYWYITNSGELDSIVAIPSFLGKQATLIVQGTVPSWLEINNPTPELRYVYPDLAGSPTISASQPSVGTGRVGSPTVAAINGTSYVLALNVSDEIILNTV